MSFVEIGECQSPYLIPFLSTLGKCECCVMIETEDFGSEVLVEIVERSVEVR